ncbi:hypothetical protein ABZ442_20090 [Streptomyces triculaminicus]|uniref:hypothetical protein n=1 Tax=Streptomyces triculaminicus TaxID=2816232 RepID=UPI0033D4B52F
MLLADVFEVPLDAVRALDWPYWLPGRDAVLALGPGTAVPALREALSQLIDCRSFVAFTPAALTGLALDWAERNPYTAVTRLRGHRVDAGVVEGLERHGAWLNSLPTECPRTPSTPPDASELPDRLYPLEAEAAVAALAIMAEEWQSEPAPVRSRPDQDAVLADARTLLDRYGPTARYWTNATAAASDPAPDFLAAGLQGTKSHSFLTSEYLYGLDLFEDLGLIAVAHDEVGVFWSFGAY